MLLFEQTVKQKINKAIAFIQHNKRTRLIETHSICGIQIIQSLNHLFDHKMINTRSNGLTQLFQLFSFLCASVLGLKSIPKRVTTFTDGTQNNAQRHC